jgi:hypothetical protein
MTNQQLKEHCEAEFENMGLVITELFTVVKPQKGKYSTVELAALATFLHNFYDISSSTLTALP